MRMIRPAGNPTASIFSQRHSHITQRHSHTQCPQCLPASWRFKGSCSADSSGYEPAKASLALAQELGDGFKFEQPTWR